MSTSQEIAAGILKLSDSQFYATEHEFSEREFKLLDAAYTGLAINAPRTIDLAGHQGLPVVMASVRDARRQWEVLQEKNLTFVAWQAATGAVYAQAAYPPPEKTGPEVFSRMPPEPRDQPPYTRNAKIEMLHARQRLNLPWKPASLGLAVISYDWVSNTIQVELAGKVPDEDGQLKEVPPDEPKPFKVSPMPSPQAATQKVGLLGRAAPVLPTYESHSLMPKPPESGLALVAPSKMAAFDRLVFFGAFSTKARQWHLNPEPTVHLGKGGRKLTVAAVVPVTLLLLGLDWNVPKRFDWAVPVYANAPIREGSPLTGCFGIDALAGSDIRLTAGRYMAYAVFDGRLFGPREIKI